MIGQTTIVKISNRFGFHLVGFRCWSWYFACIVRLNRKRSEVMAFRHNRMEQMQPNRIHV